jgi:hypothetical protein
MITPVKFALHARGNKAAEEGKRTQGEADADGNRGFPSRQGRPPGAEANLPTRYPFPVNSEEACFAQGR